MVATIARYLSIFCLSIFENAISSKVCVANKSIAISDGR